MSRPPDWRAQLFSRRTLGVRLGLDRVRAVDERLGRPCAGLPVVQIVGTNGKGSTSAMLAHGLGRSGRRVGLYTSPHLHRVGERVRIDGEPVPDGVIQATTDRVIAAEQAAGVRLSFFEVITLAGLLAFADAGVDVLVLEAGLGGRLDATRVRESAVTLVTRIGIDHERYLGEGIERIAEEKAAVLHAGAPAFSVAQRPEVVRVLERAAAEGGTSLTWVSPLASAPLPGAHQRENAALALAGLRALVPEAGAERLEGVRWPGRLESVPAAGGQGEWIFDVAHNLDGIEALAEHFRGEPPDLIVFGCMADKDVAGMLDALARLGAPLWWVSPPGEGAMPAPRERVNDGCLVRTFASADEPALALGLSRALEQGRRVLVCGSHFLVARLRAAALELAAREVDSPELSDPLLRK